MTPQQKEEMDTIVEASRVAVREKNERESQPTKWSIVLIGKPRTKKNSGRRRWSKRDKCVKNIPSEAFEEWQDIVLPQLQVHWMRLARGKAITQPVNVRALFYRDALRGDAVGYYQALADVLQKAGVVKDDVLVEQWDGSRLYKDADRPRVELHITLLSSVG